MDTDSVFAGHLRSQLESAPPIVLSDWHLVEWLHILNEETSDYEAKYAASLYIMLSRGWTVLPEGHVFKPQWIKNYKSSLEAHSDVTLELHRLRDAGKLVTFEEAKHRFPHALGNLEQPEVTSPLGVIIKQSAGRRKVRIYLDPGATGSSGTSLNNEIVTPPTRLPSVRQAMASIASLGRYTWIYKADARDAFLNVFAAETSIKHLGIFWMGVHYVYLVMPFGFTHAPSCWQLLACAVTRAVMRRQASFGLVIGNMPSLDQRQDWATRDVFHDSDLMAYLDDWAGTVSDLPPLTNIVSTSPLSSLVIPTLAADASAPSVDNMVNPLDGSLINIISVGHQKAVCAYAIFAHTAKQLGLPLQDLITKTCPPSQELDFLGIVLDTVKMQISLSKDRVNKLVTTLRDCIDLTFINVRALQSVIGVLVFCSIVITAAKPYYRRLLNALKAVGTRPPPHLILEVSDDMRDDWTMWIQMLSLFNGRCITSAIAPPEVKVKLYTDACFSGSGFFFGGRYSMYKHPPHWRALMGQTGGWIVTINFLESVALLLGLREILPLVAGGYKRLVCMIDNTAVVGQLNGSSKDDDMKLSAASPMPLLVYKEIAWLCSYYGVTLIGAYIKSEDNEAADITSRASDSNVSAAMVLDTIRRWSALHPDATFWSRRAPARPELEQHIARFVDPIPFMGPLPATYNWLNPPPL